MPAILLFCQAGEIAQSAAQIANQQHASSQHQTGQDGRCEERRD